MKIIRLLDENYNKVKSKYELNILLNEYKNILNKEILDYLNSLIELDFSCLKDYIDDNQRKILSNFDIYKYISIYNIYNKAINMFDNDFIKTGNNNGIQGLIISSYSSRVKIFDFDYDNKLKIYRDNDIPFCTISLYKTIESEEVKECELERIVKILKKLKEEEDSYKEGWLTDTYYLYNLRKKIREYEVLFNKIDEKIDLTKEEIDEIELTNKYNQLLLEEYGLSDDDFKEEKNWLEESSYLNKTLVKNKSGIKVINNIKYI